MEYLWRAEFRSGIPPFAVRRTTICPPGDVAADVAPRSWAKILEKVARLETLKKQRR
jgi:hypothetical protein